MPKTATSMPIDRQIGARIRARRLQLGMSQEKLGNALDLTFQQIQKYEKGANRVAGSTFCRLARVLQVDEAFFFEGVQGGHKNGHDVHVELFEKVLTTRDGQELNEAFAKIKPEARRHVVALAKLLAA